MKYARDALELAGLALVVAVVWLATGLLWATLLAAAAVLVYLSHSWEFGSDDADELARLRADLEDWHLMASRHGVPKVALGAVQAILDGSYFREADRSPAQPQPIVSNRRAA